jgi:hypothetical protein
MGALRRPGSKHGERGARRQRARNDTLVLLDQEASRVVGGSPEPWTEPRHGRQGGFRRKREASVIAVAVVAMLVGAGVVLLRPHAAPASQSLPILGSVPSSYQKSSPTTPSPSPTTAHPRHPRASASPAMAQPAPSRTTTTEAPPPTVVVTYRIIQEWYGGFKAEVEVVNNTSEPISDWQMAVALEHDTFTAWWNAAGFMSNGILVLSQPWWQGPIAADGGTLQVFFVVSGFQPIPNDCGFQTYTCTIGS